MDGCLCPGKSLFIFVNFLSPYPTCLTFLHAWWLVMEAVLWCACMLGEGQVGGEANKGKKLQKLSSFSRASHGLLHLLLQFRGSLLLASLCLPQEQRGIEVRQSQPGSQPLAVLGKSSWDGRSGQHGEHLVASCYSYEVQRQGELGEASLRCKCRKL